MVLTVQYTPKTGINAGKQCFPVTCGNMFKSGLYRLEKTETDGNVKVEFRKTSSRPLSMLRKAIRFGWHRPTAFLFW